MELISKLMWIILFGRIAQFLLMLATLRVATSKLTPAEMGKIAIVTTIVAFVSSFLINPVGMYVNRQLHRWQNEALVTRYIGYHYVYVLFVAIASSFLIKVLCTTHLLNTHLPDSFMMMFVFLTVFFNTVNQTSIPSLNLLGFRGWFTILSIATVLFSLLFALFFVTYFNAQTEFWLLGILSGQILFALIGTWIFYVVAIRPSSLSVNRHPATCSKMSIHEMQDRCNSREQVVRHQNMKVKGQLWTLQQSITRLQSVFKFVWPIAIAVGLTWFQSQSYRFFIEHSFGLSALGLFVAGYGISAGMIAGFESVFVTYFQPYFYRAISDGSKANRAKAWDQYALAIIPSVLLVAFIISALSSKLTYLMLAPSFQSASEFVMWGAFAEAFRVISNVYNMVAHAEQNTKMLILPNVIGAIICVALIYLLIPKCGVFGVALALVLAGFVVTLYLHLSLKKKLSICVPYYEITQAVLFGMLIWVLNYCYTFLWQESILITCFQFLMVGILYIIAEYYLLKMRGVLS